MLPILPILVAGALSRHRFGLWALAAGLALSFATIGVFVATLGASIGIDGDLLRTVVGVLLIVFGAVMAVPALQRVFAAATSRFAGGGDRALSRVQGHGWAGQFAVGLLLGIVWTPCVGPTLGAATTLASQGTQLGQVAALMLVFGLGAATPLVVVGTLSRRIRIGSRSSWLSAAETIRRALGVLLVIAGALVLTGLDRHVEAWLLDRSPDWLTELTTRF